MRHAVPDPAARLEHLADELRIQTAVFVADLQSIAAQLREQGVPVGGQPERDHDAPKR